jgi:hypothetical protein
MSLRALSIDAGKAAAGGAVGGLFAKEAGIDYSLSFRYDALVDSGQDIHSQFAVYAAVAVCGLYHDRKESSGTRPKKVRNIDEN